MRYSNTRHLSSGQKSKENGENHLLVLHGTGSLFRWTCLTKHRWWSVYDKKKYIVKKLKGNKKAWDRLWHQGVLNRVTCRRITGKTFQVRRLTEAQQWPPWCVQWPPPWCVQPARWWPPQSPILAPLVSSTIEHISSSHDISTIHHFVNL